MCRKLPWPRCAYHARIALERAITSGDDTRIAQKTDEFNLTVTGIKIMKENNLFKKAERFQARRNAIIRRIKENVVTPATQKIKKSSSVTSNSKSPYFGVIKDWEVIEERARINIGYYAGKKYYVSSTGKKNSTYSDIKVTNRNTGKIGYIEVKKLPSRAGLQAVLTEKDGVFYPSSATQDPWVKELCRIVNSRSIKPNGQMTLSPYEQQIINQIIVNHYKKRNIIALMFTDESGKDFSLCAVEDIPQQINIVLDAPRYKESGSSSWAKSHHSYIPTMTASMGFDSDSYKVVSQDKKTYLKFNQEPSFGNLMIKNQSGFAAVDSFNGILPQLSHVEGSDRVFELRKRSATANPTVIIRFGKPKQKITRYKTAVLSNILSQLDSSA